MCSIVSVVNAWYLVFYSILQCYNSAASRVKIIIYKYVDFFKMLVRQFSICLYFVRFELQSSVLKVDSIIFICYLLFFFLHNVVFSYFCCLNIVFCCQIASILVSVREVFVSFFVLTWIIQYF